MVAWHEFSPAGETAKVQAGDFILCHRKGLASKIIRIGEKVRWPQGAYWSHAACCINEDEIVEALTRGVVRNPLSEYHGIPYTVVHTELNENDAMQATAFALDCVGDEYGWSVIFGIALRFLTPGRGLWFGMNGVEICSGLVAQAETRGWKIFKENPASITPTELAIAYEVRKG